MGRLDGKVAIVTGAARGMGEAEARRFVAEGAKVVVADILDDEGSKVADDLGPAAAYVHVDVSSEEDWVGAVETAAQFGPLNVLVNNAGIARMSALVDTTLEEYMAVIAVNQVGAFLGMRAAVAPMRAAGGGSIVNISSIDGIIASNGLTSYVASKFAVRGMTKTAAIELGYDGIRVNSIHPGIIGTPLVNPDHDLDPREGHFSRRPIPRIGRSEEVANMALFLASDEASYCTGAEFVVDGGMTCGYMEDRLPGLPLTVAGSL